MNIWQIFVFWNFDCNFGYLIFIYSSVHLIHTIELKQILDSLGYICKYLDTLYRFSALILTCFVIKHNYILRYFSTYMNYVNILLAKINHFNSKIADSNYSDIHSLYHSNYSSIKHHLFQP